MPTISSHGFVESSPPIVIRLPIAFWPGQKRRTTLSLTMTTGLVEVASASVNHMIKALAAHRANQALTQCVRLGHARRRLQHEKIHEL